MVNKNSSITDLSGKCRVGESSLSLTLFRDPLSCVKGKHVHVINLFTFGLLKKEELSYSTIRAYSTSIYPDCLSHVDERQPNLSTNILFEYLPIVLLSHN